ncbi:RHE_PE00001 family protein [Agrobacterium sp. rho-13.3]|uniref:RHE_PE00001 family protein n=1 Tax=Agrobacterium sp. rho-13.3 TaxID=3072980 RepID=UPI002A0E87A5|nr:RHE_PE00001 family protein [Agrobacterium sp. rho-13.3]MDX8306371.1 RHE_PE00001 family protein [Agrobacterium sp. rho-13.3]MDX8307298.1 RHE_PE00001 family protein [Agrobacterium sp. rho-13.3]
MLYDVHHLPLQKLISPCVRATEALARLDERISRSPLKQGFLERQDFTDAVSSLWVDGELVHIEDLVLHDAHMDIRAPTHEMTIANQILRTRRQIIGNEPKWALSTAGLSRLRGDETKAEKMVTSQVTISDPDDDDAPLSDELSEIDKLIARSSATLDSIATEQRHSQSSNTDTIIRDPDWNEDERLDAWRAVLKATNGLPPTLRAAIALDAWHRLEVLQRSAWLGRQLAAGLLREEMLTLAHLTAFNIGLRAIPRERRHAPGQTERLIAFLDGVHEAATLGMKEHDRLLNAKSRMERRLVGRRSNSRLPDLIALVLARPVVSTSMIVKALGTTPQGAVGLANQLELREMTGRGRFRAWGVL